MLDLPVSEGAGTGSRKRGDISSLGLVSLQIRPLAPADIDRVVELALRAWEPVLASMAAVLGARLNRRVYPDWASSQAKAVRDVCADPKMKVLVAADDEALLGFICVAMDETARSGEIDMIAVDPRAQRRGTAYALIESGLALMRSAGCTLAHVATGGDDGHAPARALYEAAGFTALPLVRYYREL